MIASLSTANAIYTEVLRKIHINNFEPIEEREADEHDAGVLPQDLRFMWHCEACASGHMLNMIRDHGALMPIDKEAARITAGAIKTAGSISRIFRKLLCRRLPIPIDAQIRIVRGWHVVWKTDGMTSHHVQNAIVHGLMAGSPLCGFTQAKPVDWPVGNIWVDVALAAEKITCLGCKRVATTPKN